MITSLEHRNFWAIFGIEVEKVDNKYDTKTMPESS